LNQRLNEHRTEMKVPDDVKFPTLFFDNDNIGQLQSGRSSGFEGLVGNGSATNIPRDWDSLVPFSR